MAAVVDQPETEGPAAPAGAFVEGKENEENVEEKRTLAEMFEQGQGGIETSKNSNLFQELQDRALTDKEQEIVKARTAHMQKMFEVYEKREKKRKVQELLTVCPDMTEAEVSLALEMYDGNEEETAMALTSEPKVKQKVKDMANGTYLSSRPSAVAPAKRPKYKAPAPVTKGGIFVGGFRGKLPPSGLTGGAASRKAKRAAEAPDAAPPAPAPAAVPKRRRSAGITLRGSGGGDSPCENAKIDDLVPVKPEATAAPEKRTSPTRSSKRKADSSSPLQAKAAEKVKAGEDMAAKTSVDKKKKEEEEECNSEATKSLASDSALMLGQREKKEPGSVKSSEKAATKAGAKRPGSAAKSRGKKLQFAGDEKAGGNPSAEAATPAAAAAAPAAAPKPEASSSIAQRKTFAKRGGKGGIKKKPSLGRVRQKSTKRGEVTDVGTVVFEDGWHNKGYIFPDGFKAKTPFRSSVELDQLVIHECSIIGKGKWPIKISASGFPHSLGCIGLC